MAEEKTTPSKLEDLKINQNNFQGIVALKDRPNEPAEYGGNGLSAEDLKKAFDKTPFAVLEGLNKLIDFLRTEDYSGEIKINRGDYTTLYSLVSSISGGGFSNILRIYLGEEEYLTKDVSLYDNLTARIKYFLSKFSEVSTAIDTINGDIKTVNEETIPAAKSAAVVAAKQYTEQTVSSAVSSLKGEGLSKEYDTLAKIEAKVTELFGKIQTLIGEGDLSAAFDTLVEVDKYLTDHESLYEALKESVDGAVLLDPTKKGVYEQEIKGGLSVEWDFIARTLLAKGAFIACNNGGEHNLAGLVFPDGGLYTGADEGDMRQEAYAIAFDRKTKTLRLGNGTIYRGYGTDFDFKWGQDQYYIGVDQAIATRADEIADGNIPKWDAAQKMFVDSGSSLGDIESALDNIIAIQNSLIGGNA